MHWNGIMTLSFNNYQKRANTTAQYPQVYAFPYLATGLASEAGEVAGLVSKGIPKNLKNTVFPFKYNDFDRIHDCDSFWCCISVFLLAEC
mgnify:CR=1 FL=1